MKLFFRFFKIVFILVIFIVLLGGIFIMGNKYERICQMIGGQYLSCTSYYCPPGVSCASVCGPSKCEIVNKSKIITNICQSDLDCMIIPNNCISVYKYGFDLKNVRPLPKGKEQTCDKLQPVCQKGKCTTTIKN